jgi:arylformamidase
MMTMTMAEISEVYDISPEISSHIAVFPGDRAFERCVTLDFTRGDNLMLSEITTTPHVGAHTDAPNHYHRDGAGIETRALRYYLGPCQVVTVKLPRGKRIDSADVAALKITAQRVLFKTQSFPDPNRWDGNFNSLSAALVDALASKGVILVGIDTPSIDPAEDKALESHQAVFRNNMAILEGIVLDQVPDGYYNLAALPLKIKNADASPVRAVLWKS